jgi:hypothetical protein
MRTQEKYFLSLWLMLGFSNAVFHMVFSSIIGYCGIEFIECFVIDFKSKYRFFGLVYFFLSFVYSACYIYLKLYNKQKRHKFLRWSVLFFNLYIAGFLVSILNLHKDIFDFEDVVRCFLLGNIVYGVQYFYLVFMMAFNCYWVTWFVFRKKDLD